MTTTTEANHLAAGAALVEAARELAVRLELGEEIVRVVTASGLEVAVSIRRPEE